MTKKADPTEVMLVEPMVVAATAQRRARHVQVDHMLGAAGDSRHGEPAGVSEQVEYTFAARLLADPAPAVAHVEKQPVVLFDAKVELVAKAILGDHPLLGRLSKQRLHTAVRQVAVLQQ